MPCIYKDAGFILLSSINCAGEVEGHAHSDVQTALSMLAKAVSPLKFRVTVCVDIVLRWTWEK